MAPPIVLVTGSSSGLGKALCHAFHQQGCRVVATARQVESIADLKTQGMLTLPLDVTDSSAIQHVVDTIVADIGRIDILVNNAGFGQFGPLMDIPPAKLQAQFQTNVLAPMALIQQVVPVMKRQHTGLILNIGSISGLVTTPFSGAYCASKAALHSLSEAMRMELAPFGISVVTVQPGAVQSNFGQSAAQSLAGVISPNSWYFPLESIIQERAYLSQQGATPASEFAKQLVTTVIKPNPPAVVRLGKKSVWLPLLKQLLPTWMLEHLLKRRFGLAHFKESDGSSE